MIQDGVIEAPNTTPPQTTITKGPSGQTTDRTPTFRFLSSESGSTFECKLDAKAWRSCVSPKTYALLAFGSHTFRARATDATGNTDPSPATRRFKIVGG